MDFLVILLFSFSMREAEKRVSKNSTCVADVVLKVQSLCRKVWKHTKLSKVTYYGKKNF